MHRVIHRADHELTAGKVLLELGLALVVLSIRRYDGQDFLGVLAVTLILLVAASDKSAYLLTKPTTKSA